MITRFVTAVAGTTMVLTAALVACYRTPVQAQMPVARSSALPVEAGEGCISTAPVSLYARRIADYTHSEIFCGDFDSDGRADAIAFMYSTAGGCAPSFEANIFRNTGGALRYARTVPELYGQPQLAEFTSGKIILRMMRLLPGDSRCGPTGRSRVQIDPTTGGKQSALLPPQPMRILNRGRYSAGSCAAPRVALTYDGRTAAFSQAENSRPARPFGKMVREGSVFLINLAGAGGAKPSMIQIEPVSANTLIFDSDFEGKEGDPMFTVMRFCRDGEPAHLAGNLKTAMQTSAQAPVSQSAPPRKGMRALQVEFVLSPGARAHFTKGHKLNVHISYRGMPITGNKRGLEFEEDGFAWLGNSNSVLVSSDRPIAISPTAAITAKQSQVQQIMVSAHGTQSRVGNDWRQPVFACLDDQERPIETVKGSLKLRSHLSTETEVPALLPGN